VLTRPVNDRVGSKAAHVVDSAPRSTETWQERFRDPALTVLLILELCMIFLAVPLAAKGLSVAQAVADTLVLAVIAIVAMLSLRWNAIILILLGLGAIVASFVISAEASPISVIMRAVSELRDNLLGPDLGRGACALCAWPDHDSSASRRRERGHLPHHCAFPRWSSTGNAAVGPMPAQHCI
jgi:hypothetical protein